MNRNEFIGKLDSYLKGIAEDDKKEIIYDYEEHFIIGIEQGKTENEIAEALGDPIFIAKQFRNNYFIKKAETETSTRNMAGAVFASVGVGFMNLLLVPLIIAAACVLAALLLAGGGILISIIASLGALLIAFYVTALSMTLSGIGIIIAIFVQPYFPEFISIDINTGSAVFLSTGVICLGLLSFIGAIKASKPSCRWIKTCIFAFGRGTQKCVKGFYMWILKYLKMNAAIIKGRKENENA